MSIKSTTTKIPPPPPSVPGQAGGQWSDHLIPPEEGQRGQRGEPAPCQHGEGVSGGGLQLRGGQGDLPGLLPHGGPMLPLPTEQISFLIPPSIRLPSFLTSFSSSFLFSPQTSSLTTSKPSSLPCFSPLISFFKIYLLASDDFVDILNSAWRSLGTYQST